MRAKKVAKGKKRRENATFFHLEDNLCNWSTRRSADIWNERTSGKLQRNELTEIRTLLFIRTSLSIPAGKYALTVLSKFKTHTTREDMSICIIWWISKKEQKIKWGAKTKMHGLSLLVINWGEKTPEHLFGVSPDLSIWYRYCQSRATLFGDMIARSYPHQVTST